MTDLERRRWEKKIVEAVIKVSDKLYDQGNPEDGATLRFAAGYLYGVCSAREDLENGRKEKVRVGPSTRRTDD